MKSKMEQPLILDIANKKYTEKKLDLTKIKECQYGMLCAHLRVRGKCMCLHKRNHFLALNIVPPIHCIDEEDKKDEKLSKKQKKDNKILEKTIKENINVEELTKKETELKQNFLKEQSQKIKQILQKVDQKQKIIQDILKAESINQIYQKLSEIRNQQENHCNIAEIKRRYLMQLKKKNEAHYSLFVEKEFKAVSRLIKNCAKFKRYESLKQDYIDINHDTPDEIKNCLKEADYSQERTILLDNSKIFEQSCLNGNAQFFNMAIPYSTYKKLPYIKFYVIDCNQKITFESISKKLLSDFLKDFHSKCKGFSEYPFGKINENSVKFESWVSKLKQKYEESVKKFVFIFQNFSEYLKQKNTPCSGQFESQQRKQKQQVFKQLIKLFNPIVYYTGFSKKSYEKLKPLIEQFDPLCSGEVKFIIKRMKKKDKKRQLTFFTSSEFQMKNSKEKSKIFNTSYSNFKHQVDSVELKNRAMSKEVKPFIELLQFKKTDQFPLPPSKPSKRYVPLCSEQRSPPKDKLYAVPVPTHITQRSKMKEKIETSALKKFKQVFLKENEGNQNIILSKNSDILQNLLQSKKTNQKKSEIESINQKQEEYLKHRVQTNFKEKKTNKFVPEEEKDQIPEIIEKIVKKQENQVSYKAARKVTSDWDEDSFELQKKIDTNFEYLSVPEAKIIEKKHQIQEIAIVNPAIPQIKSNFIENVFEKTKQQKTKIQVPSNHHEDEEIQEIKFDKAKVVPQKSSMETQKNQKPTEQIHKHEKQQKIEKKERQKVNPLQEIKKYDPNLGKPLKNKQIPQRQEFDDNSMVNELAEQLFYYLERIEMLAEFRIKSKEFYTKKDLKELYSINILGIFYLGQQFYYYTHFAGQILTGKAKGKALFSIEEQQLALIINQPDIVEQIELIPQTLEKTKKMIKQNYEMCKSFLRPDERILLIDAKTNWHLKCCSQLIKEFRKIYELISGKSVFPKQYAKWGCYLLEIYCVLKLLNGEDLKEFDHPDDIQDHSSHLQKFKHLIISI